jgi:Family of unknown function (DUF5908)
MPVTINEVEINTTVTENQGSQTQSGGAGASKDGKPSPEEMERIIDACMIRVKELLDELKER